MIFRQALAYVKNISIFSPDPIRAEKAMIELLSSSVKLCNRVLTKNVLNRMYRCKLYTKDVDSYVHKQCKFSMVFLKCCIV